MKISKHVIRIKARPKIAARETGVHRWQTFIMVSLGFFHVVLNKLGLIWCS